MPFVMSDVLRAPSGEYYSYAMLEHLYTAGRLDPHGEGYAVLMQARAERKPRVQA